MRGNVRVQIEAGVAGRDAADFGDGGGFSHDKRRAAHRATTEMDEMPGIGMAVYSGNSHMEETAMRFLNSSWRKRSG
jgi:hypothetical protein